MPATTSARGGTRDLLLVGAIGMFACGLLAVAAGVTDVSRTFVTEPVARALAECPCERSSSPDPVTMAYASPHGSSGRSAPTVIVPESRREWFLGETAVMRDRARAGRQDDPRGFLQAAARASRLRGVGLFLAEDIPPLAGDK